MRGASPPRGSIEWRRASSRGGEGPPTEVRVVCAEPAVIRSRPDVPGGSGLSVGICVGEGEELGLLAANQRQPGTRRGRFGYPCPVRRGFRRFGYLRRRRNELEYPSASTAASDADEANQAVAESRSVVPAAEQIFRTSAASPEPFLQRSGLPGAHGSAHTCPARAEDGSRAVVPMFAGPRERQSRRLFHLVRAIFSALAEGGLEALSWWVVMAL